MALAEDEVMPGLGDAMLKYSVSEEFAGAALALACC